MSISKKLGLLALIAALALLMVGITGLVTAKVLANQLKAANSDTIPSLIQLAKIDKGFVSLRLLTNQRSIIFDSAGRDAVTQKIDKQAEGIETAYQAYEKLVSNKQDQTLLDNSHQVFLEYRQFQKETAAQIADDSEDGQAKYRQTVARAVDISTRLNKAIEEHLQFNLNLAEEGEKASTASAQRGEITSWIIVILGCALVIGSSLFIRQGILNSLRGMQQSVTTIEGQLDFTIRVPVLQHDEIGQTALLFNRLLDRLQQNLQTVVAASRKIASAADEMAESSDQVAKAASQQSSAASSMAASMEEMAVSIGHVGDRAQETHALASDSGKLAVHGEQVIAQTVADIHQIAEVVHDSAEKIRSLESQSRQISSVVMVIKEVADQTNLLALNAAIEAARAGEQGRGFAVVADEVRKLAERTAASTREITATIDAIGQGAQESVTSMENAVTHVSAGVERASDASSTILKIEESSRQTVFMVDEISSSLREQSQASTSVAQMVERIAQMSEESSSAAEEGAHHARTLDELAIQLRQIVEAYRL